MKGKLTGLLAGTANGFVVLIQDDAHLVHQADLFFIVTGEIVAVASRGCGRRKDLAGQGSVDIREEGRDIVGRNPWRGRRGGCGGHGGRQSGMD